MYVRKTSPIQEDKRQARLAPRRHADATCSGAKYWAAGDVGLFRIINLFPGTPDENMWPEGRLLVNSTLHQYLDSLGLTFHMNSWQY